MSELVRGVYRYWRDGVLQKVLEPWTLHRSGQSIRLEGERRIAAGPLLRVTADLQGGDCRGMTLRWKPPVPAAAIEAEYRRDGAQLRWHRRESGAELQRTLDLSQGWCLFPLLRAAAGPLLLRLAAAPGMVVVPGLHQDPDADRFLHPLTSQRWAELRNGAPAQDEQHYRYYGGEYGEQGSDYWLDALGLVRRYRWESAHGVWEVRLEQCRVAPEFQGFN